MEWSIQQISRLAGVTSRTLRHYDDVELLRPARVAANGYRYYDERSLARLQRILLLRQVGVGIPAIRQSLDAATDDEALRVHLTWLHRERDRIDRQILAVEHTVQARERGAAMDAAAALDGFDQRQYEQEVTERWGRQPWDDGQQWWGRLTDQDKAAFQDEHRQLAAGYAAALESGATPESDEAQALALRHYRWIAASWQQAEPDLDAFVALGDMYVADERFAAAYGGPVTAAFVRDAMRAFAAGRTA